ncbi:MAG: AAA domain-containing protein, partial [Candidatus Thorarchaeota archaeon]
MWRRPFEYTRSRFLAYRNLPSVTSDEVCENLMYAVWRGLRDISKYLGETIQALEGTRVRINVVRMPKYETSAAPKHAAWFKIVDVKANGHDDLTRRLRTEDRAYSESEIEGVSPFRLNTPRIRVERATSRSLSPPEVVYPVSIIDYDPTRKMICLAPFPKNESKRSRERLSFWIIPSTYVYSKQREAVRSLIEDPSGNLEPLLNLFQPAIDSLWPNIEPEELREDEWLFLTDRNNPSTMMQREFVARALNATDFVILWGPPGSGKTYSLMELIYQAVRRGMRVLFCASTHVAIDQALERLLENPRVREVVSPLRIGDPDRADSMNRNFVLSEFASRIRKENIEKLRAVSNRTEAQDIWLECISSDEGQKLVEEILVKCANLVCGTHVGILQHPEIKNGSSWFRPTYDILIVDEASKTTFHEFLVPARFAKRWVLCGDPRQLSPYVDEHSITSVVSSLLKEDEKECCYDIYLTAKDRNPRQLLLIDDREEVQDMYRKQAEAKDLNVCVVDNETDLEDIGTLVKILGSSVIICSRETAKGLSDHIPGSIDIIRGDMDVLGADFRARRQYHKENLPSTDGDWATELTIVMGQEYSTRQTRDGIFERYVRKKRLLLPEFRPVDESEEDNNEEIASAWEDRLNRIRLCAYPSVLELLIEGFRPEARFNCTLNRGFPREVKKGRLVELEYQFRMHPDISAIPRKHVYGDRLLKDGPSIDEDRNWAYRIYSEHAIWIEVRGEC